MALVIRMELDVGAEGRPTFSKRLARLNVQCDQMLEELYHLALGEKCLMRLMIRCNFERNYVCKKGHL